MNQNLEKMLYLGTGLLLCLVSLNLFFNHYEVFQSYISSREHQVQEDKLVSLEQDSIDRGISYEEVIFMVLEAKKQKEASELSGLYASTPYLYDPVSTTPGAVSTGTPFPEIRVNGVKAEELDLQTLKSDMVFQCSYQTDAQGRIIVLSYTSIH